MKAKLKTWLMRVPNVGWFILGWLLSMAMASSWWALPLVVIVVFLADWADALIREELRRMKVELTHLRSELGRLVGIAMGAEAVLKALKTNKNKNA